MGTSDGSVGAVTKVVDHGPDNERWAIVVLPDGFTAAELPTFHAKVNDLVAGLQTIEPFQTLWSKINVHRIDVTSVESGLDEPAGCGGATTATTKRTYFDATFCGTPGIRRAVTVNDALVLTTVNAKVTDWEAIVVIVNTAEIGGTGGQQIATYTLHPVLVQGVAHEFGHLMGLGDEYDYDGQDTYSGTEPSQPNATTVTDRSKLKWRHHLARGSGPVPTMTNPDCTKPDTRPSTLPAGTVGLFGGTLTHRCAIYRPTYDCGMRTVDPATPFCVVCRETMTKKINARSTPSGTCFVATAVYGDAHHPDVAWLRLWRDRHLQPGARGRSLVRLAAGVYVRVGPSLARATARQPHVARTLRDQLFAPLIARAREREGAR